MTNWVEDTPLGVHLGQFNVSDVDSTSTQTARCRWSLVLGLVLQTLVDGDWKSVVVNQIITKVTIDGEFCVMLPSQTKAGITGSCLWGRGASLQ